MWISTVVCLQIGVYKQLLSLPILIVEPVSSTLIVMLKGKSKCHKQPSNIHITSALRFLKTLKNIVACLFTLLLYWLGMVPFSGLSRFSGHFGCDGPSPLNRDTTVLLSEAKQPLACGDILFVFASSRIEGINMNSWS